jgi:hypothetical protein
MRKATVHIDTETKQIHRNFLFWAREIRLAEGDSFMQVQLPSIRKHGNIADATRLPVQ